MNRNHKTGLPSFALPLSIEIAFGASVASIAKLPHFVGQTTAWSLEVAASISGEPIGIWGNAKPLVSADGHPYLEPEDSRITEDFRLWEIAENQAYAMRLGGSSETGYSMAIPCKTRTKYLSKMYDMVLSPSSFEYYECISMLSVWVEWTRWLYVPLDPDGSHFLFLTSSKEGSLLDRMKKKILELEKGDLYKISNVGGKLSLNVTD